MALAMQADSMEIRKNTPRRLPAKVLGLVLTLGVLVALALPTQALAHHATPRSRARR